MSKQKSPIHDPLTFRIIGLAMKVHNDLGCGFQEKIYQRAVAIEMNRNGIDFCREMEMDILYDNIHIGIRRVDFFVENTIMLELKAVSELNDLHLNQAMNYCQTYGLPVGLLINFGSRKLQYKRVFNLMHPDNQDYIKNSNSKQ